MGDQLLEPGENDNTECHLQQNGMGTLICRAAKQTGENTTNEVDAINCFNCETGKIFREVGCDAVTPKIRIYPYSGCYSRCDVESLFCKIRRRSTTLDYCKTCGLVTAETTRQIVTTTRGLSRLKDFIRLSKI